MGKIVLKIYQAFLWFWGFLPEETITAMLRRQKDRIGVRTWAIMVLATLLGGVSLIFWLTLHILGVW